MVSLRSVCAFDEWRGVVGCFSYGGFVLVSDRGCFGMVLCFRWIRYEWLKVLWWLRV